MTAFRLADLVPQFRDDAGEIVVDGYLLFSSSGGSAPKSVYANPDGTGSLGAQIDLDSAGRYDQDFWLGAGEYRVRLMTADDEQVWLRDDVRDMAAGGIVPLDPADGDEDDVYTTDGVDASWQPLLRLPDPTGQDGKQLAVASGVYVLEAKFDPEEFDADNLPGGITTASGEIVIGKKCIKWGTATAPAASGALSTTLAVVFAGTAFNATPSITVTPGAAAVTGQGASVSSAAISKSSAGFTASFFAGAENTGNGSDKITSSVPFDWIAIGTTA